MIDIRGMVPEKVRRLAIEAVIREVGVDGLAFLLRDAAPLPGEYSVDRDQWLPEFESVDALMDAIAKECAPTIQPPA